MAAEEYLNRSRLFRVLSSGPHEQCVELYASRLVKDGLSRQSTWRSLNLFGDLMGWGTANGSTLTDLNEHMSNSIFGTEPRGDPSNRATGRR